MICSPNVSLRFVMSVTPSQSRHVGYAAVVGLVKGTTVVGLVKGTTVVGLAMATTVVDLVISATPQSVTPRSVAPQSVAPHHASIQSYTNLGQKILILTDVCSIHI